MSKFLPHIPSGHALQRTVQMFRPTPSLRFASPTSPPSTPLPPIPEIVRTGKKRVVLNSEPWLLSPWRLPGLDLAPEWFRHYTHISIVGFGSILIFQYFYKQHLDKQEIQIRQRRPMYNRPTYTNSADSQAANSYEDNVQLSISCERDNNDI